MSEHHKRHPDYAEMGIFAGYGEFDPRYEVWTCDADADYDPGAHAEDCFTLEEARIARKEWQQGGRGAWIRDKDTGEIVP